MSDVHYIGFWKRVAAALIDTVCILILIIPFILAFFGREYFSIEYQASSLAEASALVDFILNYILPAIVVIIFWIYKSATPGKMVFDAVIVDEKTFEKPTTQQLLVRYLCYYVSTIPLCLGLIWVGFDKRKQGWHDKIAGTVVIQKNLK